MTSGPYHRPSWRAKSSCFIGPCNTAMSLADVACFGQVMRPIDRLVPRHQPSVLLGHVTSPVSYLATSSSLLKSLGQVISQYFATSVSLAATFSTSSACMLYLYSSLNPLTSLCHVICQVAKVATSSSQLAVFAPSFFIGPRHRPH